jgi:hypothetical protein
MAIESDGIAPDMPFAVDLLLLTDFENILGDAEYIVIAEDVPTVPHILKHVVERILIEGRNPEVILFQKDPDFPMMLVVCNNKEGTDPLVVGYVTPNVPCQPSIWSFEAANQALAALSPQQVREILVQKNRLEEAYDRQVFMTL